MASSRRRACHALPTRPASRRFPPIVDLDGDGNQAATSGTPLAGSSRRFPGNCRHRGSRKRKRPEGKRFPRANHPESNQKQRLPPAPAPEHAGCLDHAPAPPAPRLRTQMGPAIALVRTTGSRSRKPTRPPPIHCTPPPAIPESPPVHHPSVPPPAVAPGCRHAVWTVCDPLPRADRV